MIPAGLFNDMYGQIALTQIVAALFCLLGNLWWAFFPVEICGESDCLGLLYVPIILMGLATGLMGGSFQSGATYLIKGKKVGTALGLFNSLINIGQFITPLIMGKLKDNY